MSNITINEKIIIKNLIINKDYKQKILPYLSEEIFNESKATKVLFKFIKSYSDTYSGSTPNTSVIEDLIQKTPGLTASVASDMLDIVDFIKQQEESYDNKWLEDRTLEFIKTQKYLNAITDAAEKYEKKEIDYQLASKLEEIYGISFDESIGLELNDVEERWELYHKQEDKVPFSLEEFNIITTGGFNRKTLNCFMSSTTGGFKSGTMCSLSCDYIRRGYNVLYLSFEMAEDKIMERIDANLLDVEIDKLREIDKNKFISNTKFDYKKSNYGRFIAKQLPTASVHSGHIRVLLNDLRLKKNFIPDVICFDYIELICSARYQKDTPMHLVLKAVCEELRGLCVETNCVGITAQQSNRNGAEAGQDISINDISSSFATSFGYDSIIAIIMNPTEDKKLCFKQLKNRYGDLGYHSIFHVKLEKAKMRLSDLDSSDFSNITESDNINNSKEALFNSDPNEKDNFAQRIAKRKPIGTNFVV